MSGFLGVAENLIGLAGQITVTIGSITLGAFEVPEAISTTTTQVLAVHRLVGGARVINAMGPDYEPIRLSGIWTGASAMQRCRAMDALREAAQPVPLTWGVRLYTVMIRSHRAEDRRNQTWIPYSIECEVLPTAPNPQPTAITAKAGILGDLQSAAQSAAGAVSSVLQPISGLISTAQAALNVVGPLLPGRTLGAAAGLLATANGAVTTGLSAADATFAATSQTNLGGLLNSSGDLAVMAQAQGFVQRAAANVAAIA